MYLSANFRNVGQFGPGVPARVLAKTDIAVDQRGSNWRELTRPEILLCREACTLAGANSRQEHRAF